MLAGLPLGARLGCLTPLQGGPLSAIDPERSLPLGTVTFLFTDIEGSTRLLSSLGDRYPALLATHNELLRDSIARHAGIEVNTEGDAFFAVFGSALDAVAAAAQAQRGLASMPGSEPAIVRVRMG